MQKKCRRFIALPLALAFAATVVLAGCSPSKTSGGGTLNYYIGEPAYIDPYNTQESEGTQVVQAVFDSLTDVDGMDATKILPSAAVSWEVNDDATVWTFKLDEAAKFHDGTAVKASDFVYAWNRIASPDTANTITKEADPSIISYHLAAIKGFDEVVDGSAETMSGLKALDDYTLEVTLSEPFADFPYVVSHPSLGPVPQKYVEEGVEYEGDTIPYGEMPIGNGPFKMSAPWKHDQSIQVVRNDDYYGDKALLDGVNFQIFKNPDSAYTAFQAGSLDFTQIGAGQIESAKSQYGTSDDGYTANPGKQVLLGDENSIYFLILNMKDPVISNPDVRKAITLAINRQAICDTVFEGTRNPADNIVPPGIAGYEEGAWADSKYDVEAAKKALADAGYPNGEGLPTITLSFNNDGGHEKIMQLIQADLKAIGINVTFRTADFPTYLKQLDAADVQIGRLGWSVDYPIMDNFLYPLFHSGSTDNKSQYSDASVDSGVEDARAITDGDDRIAAYQKANDTVQAANPVAPLMFYRHHHVASKRVNDLVYSSQNLCDFTKVWLTQDSSN